MKLHRIIILLAALFSFVDARSQQLSIKADTVIAVTGDSVSIPIRLLNMNNVGSISLLIHFNASSLVFGGGTGWLPAFDNGFNMANSSNGTIAITCVNYTGVTLDAGKLLDLRFLFTGDSSTFRFDAGSCEITDPNGITINPGPDFQHGILVSSLKLSPSVTPNPLCLGSNASLSANPTGMFGNYTYLWSSNLPGFTSSEEHPVVSPGMNTRYFVTVYSDGVVDTSSVILTVINPEPPGMVSGMLPPDSALTVNTPLSLSWAPALGATSYDLYYWDATTQVPVLPSLAGLVQISSGPLYLTQGATYRWKVIAKNACYQTPGPEYQFTVKADPELHITQVTLSPAMAGQAMEVSWTVRNDGPGPTQTPVWYDRVWISPDLEVGTNAGQILLGTFPNIGALAPGESYTNTQQIMIPSGLMGNYFIFVITDALDASGFVWPGGAPLIPYTPPPYAMAFSNGGTNVNLVKEVSDYGNYHDNFFFKEVFLSVPPLPDLVVTEIQKPATTFSGQTLSVLWKVKNQGQAITSMPPWTDAIYLSPDTSFNQATSILLKTITYNGATLPVDSLYSNSATVEIPDFISGNYYFFVKTDIFSQVYEYVYEANNVTRSDTLKIFLTPPPDLTLDSTDILVPPSASVKESVSVRFIVKNLGAATVEDYWYDEISISQSDIYDETLALPLLFTMHNGALDVGQQYGAEYQLTLPDGISGPWYVYIHTDKNQNVFEYNEDNNIKRSLEPINILAPDLFVSSIGCPVTDSADNPIEISWYRKNQGEGKLLNATFTDRIMISSNALYDPFSMISIDSLTASQNLLAADSALMHLNCSFPNVKSGNYYVYIKTDSKNQVFESNAEDNNISRSASTIEIRRPDLLVTTVNVADSALAGMPLNIHAVIKNSGPGIVLNKLVTDKIFLSSTPSYNAASAIVVGTYQHLLSLAAGDSIVMQFLLALPNGVTGTYYILYHTDFMDVVKEGLYENNNTTASTGLVSVTQGPFPDLLPVSLIAQDTVEAGYSMNLNFSVKNTGTKIASSPLWSDRIYIRNSPVWDSALAVMIKSVDHNEILKVDSTYTVNTSISISNELLEGNYYLFLFTDANKDVFEFTGEVNNVSPPLPVYISAYPIDISVSEAVTSIDTLGSGQPIHVNYTSCNNSPVQTTSILWTDALFLSADSIFDPDQDVLATTWGHAGPMLPGSNTSIPCDFVVPYTLSGDYYLFVVLDKDNLNHDIQYANNVRSVQSGDGGKARIHIMPTPPPNLVVTSVIAPAQVYSGQSCSVQFIINNNGPGQASAPWIDKLYLSGDFEINEGDVLLGIHPSTTALNPGESRSDTVKVNMPLQATGNYVLLLKTNADHAFYESDKSDNTGNTFVIIANPPPGDVFIEQVNIPSDAVVGEEATVDWTLRNFGTNALTGNLKDAIYLSSDSILDASDHLWAVYEDWVNLLPNGEITRTLTRPMAGMLPGNYHVIIKSDANNAFGETNENNNKAVSFNTIRVDFKELPLDIMVSDTLLNSQPLFYKMSLPDSLAGHTFLLTLKGDSLYGTNQVYAGQNRVPSMTEYDYVFKYPFRGNQELVIPKTEAVVYYFLVSGNTTSGLRQNIQLLGKLLPFRILSLDRNSGGNTGDVTVKVNGSDFSPDMSISLVRDSIEIMGRNLQYIDPSLVYVSFSLAYHTNLGDTVPTEFVGQPLGTYDVVASKPEGENTTLHDAFTIVQGMASSFLYNIQCPGSVRLNRNFTMSIQFVNNGNTDIPSPSGFLMSLYGAPIALSVTDLDPPQSDLYLEFREPGGPPFVLRPGAVAEYKIYSISTTRLVFVLMEK